MIYRLQSKREMHMEIRAGELKDILVGYKMFLNVLLHWIGRKHHHFKQLQAILKIARKFLNNPVFNATLSADEQTNSMYRYKEASLMNLKYQLN